MHREQIDIYRVLVLDKTGRSLAVLSARNRVALPSVLVCKQARVAEAAASKLALNFGDQIFFLFAVPSSAAANTRYLLAEHLGEKHEVRPPVHWIPISAVSRHSFEAEPDYLALMTSLQLCEAADRRSQDAPFRRLGWFCELRDWIGSVAAKRGLRITGPFQQLNASATFSLIRFQTTDSAVWFKAVGEPNRSEFPITCTLASLFPAYLPVIIGEYPACDGWLAEEVKGANLAESHEVRDWESAAHSLAALQLESLGKSAPLLAAGAHDLTTTTLSDKVGAFLRLMTPVMRKQPTASPAALSSADLAFVGRCIHEQLAAVAPGSIPDTLGHLDLNPHNLIVTQNNCVFLDWAEAYIGNPFFSLHYLIEHFRRSPAGGSKGETRLVQAYVDRWTELIPYRTAITAARSTALLAVFAYAVRSAQAINENGSSLTALEAYLRSLTRRMHYEATNIDQRRTMCLA
jgi:hypothetical protein